MKGVEIAQEMHIVNALPPVDPAGAGASDWIHMENAAHITFLVMQGVGSVATITINNATGAGGTGTATMAFDYYLETAANGDTLGAKTAATTAGVALNTNDDTMVIIEIDASQLPDGSDWINLATSSVSASILGVTAILSGYRYQGEQNITAIV